MSLTPPIIENIDRYYYKNNTILTHFTLALSALFPAGEEFFMKSFTPYLKDFPELKSQIIQFCKEEGAHTRVHEILNREHPLENIVKALEEDTSNFLLMLYKLPVIHRVLITECLEHITATLADELLLREEVQKYFTSDAKDLWLYHALEETSTSHRSLSNIIYTKANGNKLLKKVAIYPVSLILLFVVLKYNLSISIYDRKNIKYKDIIQAYEILFSSKGWVRKGLLKSFKTWS